MLHDPIETSLPEFNVYDHKNYSKQLAITDDTKFQLDRAVNLSIRRQTAYRSMAELLTYQQQNDVSDTRPLTCRSRINQHCCTQVLFCQSLQWRCVSFSVSNYVPYR